MAETTMRIAENTPEYVAYLLMRDVFKAEKKRLNEVSRKYLLDTYAECLSAIETPSARL